MKGKVTRFPFDWANWRDGRPKLWTVSKTLRCTVRVKQFLYRGQKEKLAHVLDILYYWNVSYAGPLTTEQSPTLREFANGLTPCGIKNQS